MKELQVVIGGGNPADAEMLAMLVKKLGHKVAASVSTGTDAALKIRDLSPDLVLIDISLPGDIEGVSAAEQIEALTKIPVIAVIGQGKVLPPVADIPEHCEVLALSAGEHGLALAIQSAIRHRSLKRQIDDTKEELRQCRVHIDSIVSERTAELQQQNLRQKKLLHDIELTERQLATGTLMPAYVSEACPESGMANGVITVDTDLRIVLVNEPARQMFGISGEDANGKDLMEVFSCQDLALADRIRESLMSLTDPHTPARNFPAVPVKTASGTVEHFTVIPEPIINSDNTHAGIALTFCNPAAMSPAEARPVITPENIETYTRLVHGVAHDFNNMLSSILANLQLAKMETYPDSRIFSWLNSAENGVIHARDLTQQLLTLTAEKDLSGGNTAEIVHEAPEKHAMPVEESDKKAVPGKMETASQKKILLMDDEDAILSATSDMLRFLDYTVEVARNGGSAIDLYKKAQDEGAPFDAVILDITVPGGMGAKEALPLLKKIDPGVRAIISSGYSTNPMIVDCRAFGFSSAIIKPYGFRELDEALRNAFETK